MIRDVHLIPGFWKIDGYTKMLRYIEETFDVTRGQNLFEFPYDWRRDNRVAARRLHRQSGEWLDAWRASSGASDARLVLVGHSMGGLIARYFLECLDGWRDTRALVTFGTPYRGSLNALDTLVNGKKIKFLDMTEVARSFTAIHQLLPTYPCYVDGDAGPAYVDEADIPHLDRAKAKAALDFHREIASAVESHRGDPAYSERGYDLAQSSVSSSRHSSRPNGTVTGSSSYERSKGTIRGRRDRAQALGDPARARGRPGRDVLGRETWLAAERRPPPAPAHRRSHRKHDPVERFKDAVPMIDLSLDVDDLYSPADPILVKAQPERETTGALLATAVDTETGRCTRGRHWRRGTTGWHEAELGPSRRRVPRDRLRRGPGRARN